MKDWESLEPDCWLPIGNYEPSSISKKRGVVIHHNAGVGMTHEQVKSAFLSNGTSAQYNVDGAGSVCQYVNDKDRAWHCSGKKTGKDCNTLYIGIEHADKSSDPWLIADAALEEGAHLVAALCLKYGWGRPEWRKNVFPHSDFSYTACPGELAGSQQAQYMARAQHWYDVMTGAVQPEKPVSERLPEALRGFTDLDPDAWYIGPIEECVREGYINGYKGGKEFGPSDSLTRGQAVCVMANFKRVDLTGYLEPFEDVDAEPYYYTALCWALDNGYVSTASGKFRPGDAVTRSDLLTFLWRMEGEPEPKGEPAGFPDWKDVPEWAEKPVAWAVENGVISGSKGKLSPLSACTRAEACAMLANLAKFEE